MAGRRQFVRQAGEIAGLGAAAVLLDALAAGHEAMARVARTGLS